MITVGIVISLGGNLNVLILAGSRVMYAMAERGALSTVLAEIDARYRTPVISVLVTTGIMLALTLSGTFIYLATLSTVVRLATYLITCGALPILRRKTYTDFLSAWNEADSTLPQLAHAREYIARNRQ
jgi:amino acid transporter